ncbi:MAG: DMT family transporter [Acidimicrobiales bacterium]
MLAVLSRRGWMLFGAMAVIWGMPYLLIKESVASLAPAAVVSGRTAMASLLLLPVAVKRGALRPALAHWRPVLAFTIIEMGGPFILLSHAEQTLPSGLTGLLVATVPLFGAVTAFALGDRLALGRLRVLGLALGLVGVAMIVGGTRSTGSVTAVAVAEVLLVAVCYSIAPFIAFRHLDDVPGIGIAALALGIVGVFYLPIAIATQDRAPTGRSVAALAALSVVCTALAFVVFFALIKEVGPARATVFTYINPVVALSLGVVVRGESLTAGLLIGFPVVLAGCWLAASHRDDGPVVVAEP